GSLKTSSMPTTDRPSKPIAVASASTGPAIAIHSEPPQIPSHLGASHGPSPDPPGRGRRGRPPDPGCRTRGVTPGRARRRRAVVGGEDRDPHAGRRSVAGAGGTGHRPEDRRRREGPDVPGQEGREGSPPARL